MLVKTALSPAEVRQFARSAQDRSYWRKLNPDLSVTDTCSLARIRAKPVDARARRVAMRKLDQDGYFQLDDVYPASLMRRLAQGIENLKDAKWPPVFAYVYDEYWLMKRVPSVVDLLDELLGPEHRELRNNWAHYVQPAQGSHGWMPHLDGPFLSGRLSMWFPLTHATLDNGCIYVIPESRLPEVMIDTFNARRRLKTKEVRTLLQAARALPVRAGSILGWNFRVLHWGSMASNAEQPRISVATEFASASAPGREFDAPPLDAHGTIPSFDVRLEIIGRAILGFHGFEPRMLRYAELAQRLK